IRENYERIQLGMHRSEVEAVLGRPPRPRELEAAFDGLRGTYVLNPQVTIWLADRPLAVESDEWHNKYPADVWTVIVSFDSDGRVKDKHFGAVPLPDRPSWIQSIWPF